MPRSPRARQNIRRRTGRTALAGLAIGLGLTSQFGCGREFFRHWADQDVSEAIFEKSRDPHWRLDRFTMEPPALARFANPYDVDRQPAPPDDPAANALSTTTQLPYHRLMVPAEGTGYLTMMNGGPRYESPPPQAAPPDPVTPPPAPLNPPPPGSGVPNPFNPAGNSGTMPPGATLNTGTAKPIAAAVPPSASPTTPTPARTRPKDPGVLLSSFQTPGSTATTPNGAALPSTGPGQDTPGALPALPPSTPAQDPVRPRQLPSGDRVTSPEVILDPDSRVSPNTIAGPRPDRGAGDPFLELLNPVIVLDEAQASAYPRDSRPYVIGPAEALQLALMNNRTYQYRLENIYVQGLALTTARFVFQPQMVAGLTPTTSTTAGIPSNPVNSYAYATKETGGQRSILNMGNAVAVGKALSFGGQVAAGFANTLAFNFLSGKSIQPTVTSTLPITFTQRFLQGGGRAVTLEGLTQAERTLLYEIRSFARLRQSVVPAFLTNGQTLDGPAGNAADPPGGYLNVLQNLQAVENDRNTIAGYEQLFKLYRNYVGGGASSGISQIQVDQIASQLQTQRGQLLQDEATYKTTLDTFKVGLGMPPDVPVILDRSPVKAFTDVFRTLVLWARRGGDPEELNGIILGLPKLETIVVDGRPLFRYDKNLLKQVYADPDKQMEILLAAERVALENRLDLMNARAQLFDAWRQLAVTANGLKGVFNINLSNQITTVPGNTNPLAFVDQAKQFQIAFNAELPLIRVAQRNQYRLATITYNRQQRALMDQEDAVKAQVRSEIYSLISNAENYEIGKVNLLVTIRQRDFSVRQIISPPASIDAGANAANQATQTNNLITGINNILNIQRTILSNWVTFQTNRLQLYRDLGIIPFDEWEAYYEFFPANSGSGNAASAAPDGPPVAGPANTPPPGRP